MHENAARISSGQGRADETAARRCAGAGRQQQPAAPGSVPQLALDELAIVLGEKLGVVAEQDKGGGLDARLRHGGSGGVGAECSGARDNACPLGRAAAGAAVRQCGGRPAVPGAPVLGAPHAPGCRSRCGRGGRCPWWAACASPAAAEHRCGGGSPPRLRVPAGGRTALEHAQPPTRPTASPPWTRPAPPPTCASLSTRLSVLVDTRRRCSSLAAVAASSTWRGAEEGSGHVVSA